MSSYRDIDGSITDEMLDATDDARPCDYCDATAVREVTRHGDPLVVCTHCYHEPDGAYSPPPRHNTDDTRRAFDSDRLRYDSGRVVQYGAFPAFTSADIDTHADETARYDSFLASP